MENKIDLIKQLREETGMGLVAAKQALEETNWDYDKALELLRERGAARIKPNRKTAFGCIETYNHNNRVGVIVEVNCETDFTANTQTFKSLSEQIAAQIVGTNPSSITELLE